MAFCSSAHVWLREAPRTTLSAPALYHRQASFGPVTYALGGDTGYDGVERGRGRGREDGSAMRYSNFQKSFHPLIFFPTLSCPRFLHAFLRSFLHPPSFIATPYSFFLIRSLYHPTQSAFTLSFIVTSISHPHISSSYIFHSIRNLTSPSSPSPPPPSHAPPPSICL